MKTAFKVDGLLGLGSALVVDLPSGFDLKAELLHAQSIKLATAFAHWTGWKHLEPHIEKTSAEVKLLSGLSFCQTEPAVLYDWLQRAQNGRAQARLFTDAKTTFHPKVLLVKSTRGAFVVVGSGNLSEGGLLQNIECGLFSADTGVYSRVNDWFEKLFCDDSLTSDLTEPDIRRYKKRFDAAKKARKEVETLQEQAEHDIGERHNAGMRRLNHAVMLARKFFKSKKFTGHYAAQRPRDAKKIKDALSYPQFDFDRDGLEAFYEIQSLGHLIEIGKPQAWKQRSKLRAALCHLIDDSKPIEARVDAVLDGKYRVRRVGPALVTKILAVHDAKNLPVWNKVKSVKGVSPEKYAAVLSTSGAKAEVLGAAGLVKQLAGQINVVIHALGILICLPHILRPGEIIEYVSLDAGNTGRDFDLETNQRIAEFKFIHWQGGTESIRQNSLFKDFYQMAEYDTAKEKYLYVLGTEHGEKFFNGRRALSSVLKGNVTIRNKFHEKFGDQYRTVRDYYVPRRGLVVIQDVSSFVPELVAAAVEAAEASRTGLHITEKVAESDMSILRLPSVYEGTRQARFGSHFRKSRKY